MHGPTPQAAQGTGLGEFAEEAAGPILIAAVRPRADEGGRCGGFKEQCGEAITENRRYAPGKNIQY